MTFCVATDCPNPRRTGELPHHPHGLCQQHWDMVLAQRTTHQPTTPEQDQTPTPRRKLGRQEAMAIALASPETAASLARKTGWNAKTIQRWRKSA